MISQELQDKNTKDKLQNPPPNKSTPKFDKSTSRQYNKEKTSLVFKYQYMKNSVRLKLFISFILGLSGALFMTYASSGVSIEAAINSFTQYIQRIVVTLDGTPDSQIIVDINNANSSAALLVNSTTRWFLPPRLTTAQRNAINNPANGLIIFNTNIGVHQSYNGPAGNQPEYWQNAGVACPAVSIIQVQDPNLQTTLNYGAWFYAIGKSRTANRLFANATAEEDDALGETQIETITYTIRGSLILDSNNNRILSAAEKALFDDSSMYGTISLTATGWMQLAAATYVDDKSTMRSILWWVVWEDAMLLYICGELLPWCTDPAADNYDSQANINDGSCTIPTPPTQVDMYFSSGSNSIYATSTWSNITFSSMIRNSYCEYPNDSATVTATWNTTNGSTPSFVSESYMYGSANIIGNSATWTINSGYLSCSDMPLSITLYNALTGQVSVDWDISINNDNKTSNDYMTQYGTWQGSQWGASGYCSGDIAMACNTGVDPAMQCDAGMMWPCIAWTPPAGASYDYGIFSWQSASYSTTAWSNITSSINIIDVQTACQAGYWVRVVAQLPQWASYTSSSAGMMGTAWSYDNMMQTVTWNYTGNTDCRDLATAGYAYNITSRYAYNITSSSATAYSGNITRSVSAANAWNTDNNITNNNGTHYLTWTAEWENNIDLTFNAPWDPSSNTAGSNITGSIDIIELSWNTANNVTITATLPDYMQSADPATLMGATQGYSQNGNILTWNLWTASSVWPYQVILNWMQAETQYVYRNISTTDNDIDTMNNSYSMPFTRY